LKYKKQEGYKVENNITENIISESIYEKLTMVISVLLLLLLFATGVSLTTYYTIGTSLGRAAAYIR
jgi:hypothetical protein